MTGNKPRRDGSGHHRIVGDGRGRRMARGSGNIQLATITTKSRRLSPSMPVTRQHPRSENSRLVGSKPRVPSWRASALKVPGPSRRLPCTRSRPSRSVHQPTFIEKVPSGRRSARTSGLGSETHNVCRPKKSESPRASRISAAGGSCSPSCTRVTGHEVWVAGPGGPGALEVPQEVPRRIKPTSAKRPAARGPDTLPRADLPSIVRQGSLRVAVVGVAVDDGP